MKILVLAGGLSPERAVSLSSGAMVCAALRRRGHQVALVDLFFGTEGLKEGTDPYEAPIPKEWERVSAQAPNLEEVRARRRDRSPSLVGPGVLELCTQAQIVYLALHGACGEDGRIQAMLDLLGVPYTGSGPLASALAMDKDKTKQLVAPYVRTPRWRTVEITEENLPRLQEDTPLPVVVKPLNSGSSLGVYVARTREELGQALQNSRAMGGKTLLEEYIQGREIQVALLNGRALPSIEIIPKAGFYDYETKYQPSGAEELCPAPILPAQEEEIGRAAQQVFTLLGLSVYGRADFLMTQEGEIYFLEINTLPGMTPTSLVPQEAAAAGIGYDMLCEDIVNASLQVRKEGME